MTKEVRKNITEWAKEAGVTVRSNTSCKNCWHDALVEIYAKSFKATDKDVASGVKVSAGVVSGYIFKQPNEVIIGGMGRFSATTPRVQIEALKRARPHTFAVLYGEVFAPIKEAEPKAEEVEKAEPTEDAKEVEQPQATEDVTDADSDDTEDAVAAAGE